MTESNTRKQHPQHPSLFTGGAPHAWTVHHQTTQLHFGYNNNNDTTHNNSNATNDVTNDAAAARGWCAWGQSTLYVSSSSSSSTPTNASAAATKQQSHYHHSLALHLRRSCTVESIECRGIVVGVSSTNKLEKRKSSNNAAAASLGVLSCSFAHGDPMERVLVRSSGGNDQNTNPTNRSQNTAAKATGSVSWHAADAHSSRGAAGMTTGLRAASIASNGGELRLQIMDVVPNTNNNNHNTNSTTTSNSTAAREAVHALWLDDLQRHPGQGDEISSSNNKNHAARPSFLGAAEERLRHTLHQRAGDRRRQRLEWVARRMTDAAGAHAANGNETAAATAAQCGAAFKVTIRYRISGLDRDPASIVRLAGLQAIAPPWETDTVTSSAAGSRDRTMHSLPPHVYTVAGVYGDHEGPRCWMPVLDSAAVGHRASQLLSIAVTAPVAAGLSIVGMGEDAGVTETLLHDKSIWLPSSRCTATDAAGAGETELGEGIITVMATLQTGSACSLPRHLEESTTHVIPMDYSVDQTFVQQQQYKQNQQQQVCLDSIYATTIWCGQTWTPISCRSLGFSIGPFKVLDDPEYFGPSALDETNDDDDDDEESDGLNEMKSFEDRVSAFLEKSKANGEGVRQVYFAPRFEHKYIHTMPSTHVNMTLLPNTTFRLLPLSSHQKTVAIQLDQTVSAATTGVPHRALSLMRDVLAVPSFRSQSYTQVWIPNAVHGGCTSGALHNCPEVLVNPFLGGAIMDSRLLPPVGARLPFYQGGRVLQFLQARCAVRGWITAALPLGGNDDVGTGYIFAVFEALIMSLYERGHGGQGEG